MQTGYWCIICTTLVGCADSKPFPVLKWWSHAVRFCMSSPLFHLTSDNSHLLLLQGLCVVCRNVHVVCGHIPCSLIVHCSTFSITVAIVYMLSCSISNTSVVSLHHFTYSTGRGWLEDQLDLRGEHSMQHVSSQVAQDIHYYWWWEDLYEKTAGY